jgi:hypothetical protein
LFSIASQGTYRHTETTNGQHWVQFRAVDAAGHEKVTSRQYWTVDTKAPTLALTTLLPEPPQKLNQRSANFLLSTQDNIARWQDCTLLVSIGRPMGAMSREYELHLGSTSTVMVSDGDSDLRMRVEHVRDSEEGKRADTTLIVSDLQEQCGEGNCHASGDEGSLDSNNCNHECEYEIRVRMRDETGNDAAVGSAYNWTVDSQLPIATVEIREGRASAAVLIELDKWGDTVEPASKPPVTSSGYFDVLVQCGDFLKNLDITREASKCSDGGGRSRLIVAPDCRVRYNFSSLLKCSANCPDGTMDKSLPLGLEVDEDEWAAQVGLGNPEAQDLFLELTAIDLANNTYTKRYNWKRAENCIAGKYTSKSSCRSCPQGKLSLTQTLPLLLIYCDYKFCALLPPDSPPPPSLSPRRIFHHRSRIRELHALQAALLQQSRERSSLRPKVQRHTKLRLSDHEDMCAMQPGQVPVGLWRMHGLSSKLLFLSNR